MLLWKGKQQMKIEFHNNTLIVNLYDENQLPIFLQSVKEIERYLCKRLSVEFDSTSEILIDVDDYYEYVTLRRVILDFCPIY